MTDYKELIEMLRHQVINDDDAAEIADAIEQLVKERDAAVADLGHACFCDYCKHYCKHFGYPRCKKRGRCEWEWRGVQKESE